MKPRAAFRFAPLFLLLAVFASACSAVESTPPEASSDTDELTGVRIEVHEAPG